MPDEAPPIIVNRYWITDERTGKRRLTTFHMNAEDAEARYPGDELEPSSPEERKQSGSAAAILSILEQHLSHNDFWDRALQFARKVQLPRH